MDLRLMLYAWNLVAEKVKYAADGISTGQSHPHNLLIKKDERRVGGQGWCKCKFFGALFLDTHKKCKVFFFKKDERRAGGEGWCKRKFGSTWLSKLLSGWLSKVGFTRRSTPHCRRPEIRGNFFSPELCSVSNKDPAINLYVLQPLPLLAASLAIR